MFICAGCADGRHEECRGGTWCDCQHKTDGHPQEKRRSEWRVTDEHGAVRWLSSNWPMTQRTLNDMPGGSLWQRSVIESITAWRLVDISNLSATPTTDGSGLST